jgi:site-specific DNA recombinase
LTGEVGLYQIGLGGIMGQTFLKNLGDKTRRGQIANARAGKSGGGSCYGYASVSGVRSVVPEQAAIVRRIFNEYDSGMSPRLSAQRLNGDGVPGPRNGQWTASTINGDRRIGDGILHQSLYRGEQVFNRRHFRKNPETGRRASIMNPESDWVRTSLPDLKIIDDELWDRVQSRKKAMSIAPASHRRRPKRVLSGLLTCGTCGGSMTLQGKDRFACSAHRERGSCPNSRSVAAGIVEARVMDGVKRLLLAPDAIESAMRAYEAEIARDRIVAVSQRASLEKALAAAEDRINQLLGLYEQRVIELARFKERYAGLEDKKRSLVVELQALEEPPAYTLHPMAVDRYRELVERLERALTSEDATAAREAFRGLLDSVVFHPIDGNAQFELQLNGRLAALLSPQQNTPPDAFGKGALVLGAGIGFEPMTFRL